MTFVVDNWWQLGLDKEKIKYNGEIMRNRNEMNICTKCPSSRARRNAKRHSKPTINQFLVHGDILSRILVIDGCRVGSAACEFWVVANSNVSNMVSLLSARVIT